MAAMVRLINRNMRCIEIGLQRPSEQAIRKAGATDATLVAKTHLEAERILGAVISGMGRMLALCT